MSRQLHVPRTAASSATASFRAALGAAERDRPLHQRSVDLCQTGHECLFRLHRRVLAGAELVRGPRRGAVRRRRAGARPRPAHGLVASRVACRSLSRTLMAARSSWPRLERVVFGYAHLAPIHPHEARVRDRDERLHGPIPLTVLAQPRPEGVDQVLAVADDAGEFEAGTAGSGGSWPTGSAGGTRRPRSVPDRPDRASTPLPPRPCRARRCGGRSDQKLSAIVMRSCRIRLVADAASSRTGTSRASTSTSPGFDLIASTGTATGPSATYRQRARSSRLRSRPARARASKGTGLLRCRDHRPRGNGPGGCWPPPSPRWRRACWGTGEAGVAGTTAVHLSSGHASVRRRRAPAPGTSVLISRRSWRRDIT